MPRVHDSDVMSFGDHLDELRRRLIWSLVGPIPILIVCLIFGPDLLELLLHPVEVQLRAAGLPSKLLTTSPTEAFTAYLKVSFITTLIVSTPWIVYQTWLFVTPGLYPRERRFMYLLAPMSVALTVAGLAFLYYVLLPVSLRFFILFGAALLPPDSTAAELPPGVALPEAPILRADPASPSPGAFWINEPALELRFAVPDAAGSPRVVGTPLSRGGAIAQQYRVKEYVGLVFLLGAVFVIAFQLPLVMMLLGWSGMVHAGAFAGKRRYVVFACAVAGAILTPADPISMILLALPLYGLFELGIVLMRALPASRVAGATDGGEGDA